MQSLFDKLSERLEHFLSSWWGVAIVSLLCLITYYLWGWDGIDRFIYIAGFFVVILLIGGARRNAKATHVKLDAITPGHLLDRLEEEEEKKIEAARKELNRD